MSNKLENTAPLWIRQIADSLIVLAAALSIIGVNFKPYFEAKERIAILRMELELEREKQKIQPINNQELTKINNRIKQLELVSHKPKQ